MFGYVTINKPELKIREYERYHSFYCGLCHTLKKRHGRLGQFTLTYDMTFLVIFLSSLYEPKTYCCKERCMAHPIQTHLERHNKITAYCADMNIALMFHKLLDDWKDDRTLKSIGGMNLLRHRYYLVRCNYPKTCQNIEWYLRQLSIYESENVQDIDKTAGCFGQLMGTLFDYQQDIWSPYLKRFGFYLGKFIYILDAYLDLENDQKKENYNPLMKLSQSMERKQFDQTCQTMLELMIGDACSEFEKLPLEQDVDLLRNILYAGVWKKYTKTQKEKSTRNEKGKDTNYERPI